MKLAVLKNHLSLLCSQKSYSGYCECLIFKILPLLRLIHPDLIMQWDSEKNKFVTNLDQLERRVIKEIEDIYRAIKTESLLHNTLIKERFDALEKILNNEEVYIMPPKYQFALERLMALFDAIVDAGCETLIRDYTTSIVERQKYTQSTSDIDSYQCNNCFKRFATVAFSAIQGIKAPACPICGELLSEILNYKVVTVRNIESYNQNRFVPSYFKLHALNDKFWTNLAGAWEQLFAIGWFWDIKNRDYFRKELHYTNEKECLRSRRLLELHGARHDIQKIKKKRSNNGSTRKRKDVEQLLAVVVKAVSQDLNGDPVSQVYGPEELELGMVDDVDLILKVKWADGINEICLLHSFHDDEAQRCIFFQNIIQQPAQYILLNDPYGNARKYLREAKIDGIIADIFLKESNKNGASLKDNHIILRDLPDQKLKKLRTVIQNLKSVEWY